MMDVLVPLIIHVQRTFLFSLTQKNSKTDIVLDGKKNFENN